MEALSELLIFTHRNVISGLFISVLLIALVRKYFEKIDTLVAIQIIRWLLICYSAGVVINFLLSFIATQEPYPAVFWERATGDYWFAYMIMLVGSISPLLLLVRKLGNNVYCLALVALLMDIGSLMETFIIRVVSMHRDYVNDFLPWDREIAMALQGLIMGIVILVIGNLIYQAKGKMVALK